MSNRVTRAFNRWLKTMTHEEQMKAIADRKKRTRGAPRPGQTVVQPSGREYTVDPNGCYRRKA